MSAERNDANERRRSCLTCNAFGTVYVGDEERTCPDCDGSGWVDDDSTDPTNDAPTFTLPADWQPWCPTCGHSQPQFQCRDPFHLPDKEK